MRDRGDTLSSEQKRNLCRRGAACHNPGDRISEKAGRMVTVAAISQQIWDMKYRLRGPTGEPLDKTIEDTWRRVARTVAAAETDPDFWSRRFYEAMEDFRFLPAGRVIAGAGAERQ